MLSVSTKTGDGGLTSLANGERVDKDSLIFEVIGTLDELNSWLGVVVAELASQDHLSARLRGEQTFLFKIQDLLFVIGAQVAQSPRTRLKTSHLSTLEKHSARLQQAMKKGWHTKFVLPGGHPIAARLDIARTVCRRCERRVVALSRERELAPLIKKYLNRLSDYLYVLRCLVNVEMEYSEHLFEVE